MPPNTHNPETGAKLVIDNNMPTGGGMIVDGRLFEAIQVDIEYDDPQPWPSGKSRVNVAYDKGVNGRLEEIRLTISNPPTPQSERILTDHLTKWINEFLTKNADYASSGDFNASDHLGSKGQYAELWRKIGKLRGPLWDGTELNHEQADEIVRDLIGHCFLTLLFLEDNK